MRRIQIVLFIFSVIAALAALCALFPDGERHIAGLDIRFPSLHEMLAGEETEDIRLSPEELIAQRKAAVKEAEKDRFEEFFESDPARFYLPDGNTEYFDPLFKALEGASEKGVRIVHYGDSQIEEDRISSRIREALQERFGGYGQGMMPAMKYFTFGMGCDASGEGDRFSVFGNKSDNSKYGPYGDFIRIDSTIQLNFRQMRSKDKGVMPFDRLSVLVGNVDGELRMRCAGKTLVATGDRSLSRYDFELPDSSLRASLVLSGKADIYGVLLDSREGVHLDNVAMRGCAGLVFTSISSEQLRRFYRDENVRLIILQYGGNSVPYTTSTKAVSNYAQAMRKQIAYLQKMAPEARIVLIGPSDMSTLVKGKRQTYPILPEYIDSLRANTNAAGAAYWDLYGAMGGWNSMVDWVNATPPLAGSDHVHFTRRGSEKVGEMFSDALLLYYDHYKLRKRR